MDAPAPPPAPETGTSAPLIPPALLGASAFLWMWVLPVAILSFLNLQAYRLVEGNMSASQLETARVLGWSCLGNLLAGLAMYVVAWTGVRRQNPARVLHPAWGVVPIVVQVAYLWAALALMDKVLPASVVSWIYPQERFLYNQFAFGMVPLFLGILRLAGSWRVTSVGKALAINLGFAVVAPVFLYALFWMLTWGRRDSLYAGLILALAAVVLGIIMFVGLVRALLLALFKVRAWRHGERVAIFMVALVLPLCGLTLNRSIPFPTDFQTVEVYALLLANTAILALASWQHARWPRLSYWLLCATFPFSLYFFIVFLPFTPLSILAIIALGAGFLVLTPTFLFTLHLHLLNQARRNPLIGSGQLRLILVGVGCSLLLPAFFTVRGLADKAALNAALDYVYTPAITEAAIECPINQVNLRRALTNHRDFKNGIYYPLLSDYYSWLVFDNLVLPDDKLARLEEIFIGIAGPKESQDPVRNRSGTRRGRTVRERAHMPRALPAPQTVEISAAEVYSAAAGKQATVATLTLTLRNTGKAPAEYARTLRLPAGVLVNGFRLHINGVAVAGRIVEKKTALWVYAMIRDSERRDPGLLYYDKPGELELRVFPVSPDKPTQVEIDFLVPAVVAGSDVPVYAGDLDAFLGQLGAFVPLQQVSTIRGSMVVGGLDQPSLPAVDREPYLHVIIDRSAGNAYTGDVNTALQALRQRFPAAKSVRVTLANYEVNDLVARRSPWAELPSMTDADLRAALPQRGGLDLDLAVARAIREHGAIELDQAAAGNGVPSRPIFVILAGHVAERRTALDFTGSWAGVLPDLEIHEVGSDGTKFDIPSPPGASSARPLLRLGDSIRPLVPGVVPRFKAAGKDAALQYWSPETSGWRPVAGFGTQENSVVWLEGMALQVLQQDFSRSPGDAGVELKHLVEASRQSGVLLPATSYIVVENQAQWRMLDLSEKQKLGQNSALSFLETPAPPGLYVAGGFLLWLGYRRLRRRREVTAGELG